jgi:hypothetical protein
MQERVARDEDKRKPAIQIEVPHVASTYSIETLAAAVRSLAVFSIAAERSSPTVGKPALAMGTAN